MHSTKSYKQPINIYCRKDLEMKINRLIISVIMAFMLALAFAPSIALAETKIEFDTNGAANKYGAGSELLLLGKVTDNGELLTGTEITVSVTASESEIHYAKLKTDNSGFFRTRITVPKSANSPLKISVTAAGKTEVWSTNFSTPSTLEVTGFVDCVGYKEGQATVTIPESTSHFGILFSANVNYFNNRLSSLTEDRSLGYNERNRDCFTLYQREANGAFTKIGCSVSLLRSDSEGGNNAIEESRVTWLPGKQSELGPNNGGRSNKDTIFVTPGKKLVAGTTYKLVIDRRLSSNSSDTMGADQTFFFTTSSAGGTGNPGGGGGGSSTSSNTYNITFMTNDGSNQSTLVKVTAGKTFELPAAPKRENYDFKGWNTKADGTGSAFDAAYSVNEDITVYAQWEIINKLDEPKVPLAIANPFSDINDNWAIESILTAYSQGWIHGIEANLFKPNDMVSRAQLATMIADAFKLSPPANGHIVTFADINDHWAQNKIETLAALGIVSGKSDTAFAPNELVTREEAASILVRACMYAGVDMSQKAELSFADSASISTWAIESTQKAVKAGIISGKPGNQFEPLNSCSRAEAVTMIIKALALILEA